jgi:hypothetical protein
MTAIQKIQPGAVLWSLLKISVRNLPPKKALRLVASNMRRLVIIGIAIALTAVPALAVQGALGRTLPGVWIQPQGAVIGPSLGFSFSTMPIGHMGAIGGGPAGESHS